MKKINKFELGSEDILDYTPSILEQQALAIRDKFDEACYHAFEQYGYDKAWLHDPENHERIRARCIASDRLSGIPMSTIFSIDNATLFQVDATSHNTNSSILWEFRIKYLAPLEDRI